MNSHRNHRHHHYLKAYNLNIYLDLHIHIDNTMAIIKHFFFISIPITLFYYYLL